MMRYAVVLVAAALAACSAQDTRQAEESAAAELKKAREAVAAQVEKDLTATKEAMDGLRASLSELDEDVAKVYHEALDEAKQIHHGASATWAEAGEATDDAWHELGAEAKKATASARKVARRIEALTGEAKDAFVSEADTVLHEIQEDVSALETKMAELDAESREDYEKLAAAFKKDWEATKKGLDEAKESSDDTWKDARHDVNHGLLKLKAKVREAHDRLERS